MVPNAVADFHPSRDFARASRINQTYKRSGNATELLTLLPKERSAAPTQSIGQIFRSPRSVVSVCAQDDIGAMRACLSSLVKRRGVGLALGHLQRVQSAPPKRPAAAGVKRCIGSDNIYAAMSRLIFPNGTPCCWQRRRRTLTRACIASMLASTLMHSCDAFM